MRDVRVTLDGGLTLSYADQGDESGPVLVLLPGPTDSWRSYAPVLDRMPLRIRTVAVSQRGHGDSDKPATGYRVEDFAADVVSFLDALGIDRAVLAGHSGSCLFARRVAIDQPGRVAGLILEASPTTLRGNARLEALVTSVAGLRDPIDPGFARAFVVDTSSDQLEPAALNQLVNELLKVPARVWQEMFTSLLAYDDLADLGRVAARTLLIWGDSDGLIGREMQEQLAALLPCEDLLMYAGVGHTPRWEDPSRFATDAATFVERLLEDPSYDFSG
jgi:pimeloyl-ACP methyl ester carboxylesterase